MKPRFPLIDTEPPVLLVAMVHHKRDLEAGGVRLVDEQRDTVILYLSLSQATELNPTGLGMCLMCAVTRLSHPGLGRET